MTARRRPFELRSCPPRQLCVDPEPTRAACRRPPAPSTPPPMPVSLPILLAGCPPPHAYAMASMPYGRSYSARSLNSAHHVQPVYLCGHRSSKYASNFSSPPSSILSAPAAPLRQQRPISQSDLFELQKTHSRQFGHSLRRSFHCGKPASGTGTGKRHPAPPPPNQQQQQLAMARARPPPNAMELNALG